MIDDERVRGKPPQTSHGTDLRLPSGSPSSSFTYEGGQHFIALHSFILSVRHFLPSSAAQLGQPSPFVSPLELASVCQEASEHLPTPGE